MEGARGIDSNTYEGKDLDRKFISLSLILTRGEAKEFQTSPVSEYVSCIPFNISIPKPSYFEIVIRIFLLYYKSELSCDEKIAFPSSDVDIGLRNKLLPSVCGALN